jgi:hypothetical protein
MAPRGSLVILNANRMVDERDSAAKATVITGGTFAVVDARLAP